MSKIVYAMCSALPLIAVVSMAFDRQQEIASWERQRALLEVTIDSMRRTIELKDKTIEILEERLRLKDIQRQQPAPNRGEREHGEARDI